MIKSKVQLYITIYGQTGSGKTYTMTGTSLQPGLLPRIIDYLFRCVFDDQEKDPSVEYLIKCSHLEIYNEHIIDLLNPDLGNLQLREDLNKGVYVEFLTEECCSNVVEAMEVVQRGNENRHISSTQMNFESSRSHSVFTIQLESRRQNFLDSILWIWLEVNDRSIPKSKVKDFEKVAKSIGVSTFSATLSIHWWKTKNKIDMCIIVTQNSRSYQKILQEVIPELISLQIYNNPIYFIRKHSLHSYSLKESNKLRIRLELMRMKVDPWKVSKMKSKDQNKNQPNGLQVSKPHPNQQNLLSNKIQPCIIQLLIYNIQQHILQFDCINFEDINANDQRYIKLEEILKVYLEQSTESETALYLEIENGIKELREAFQLSSQLEQQLKLIIRLQNEQIVRLKHANGAEDLSNDYQEELSKALLSQAAVMKKFSDSLRIKEGSAKNVEKAKLQITENVQLLNTIVSTVNVIDFIYYVRDPQMKERNYKIKFNHNSLKFMYCKTFKIFTYLYLQIQQIYQL